MSVSTATSSRMTGLLPGMPAMSISPTPSALRNGGARGGAGAARRLRGAACRSRPKRCILARASPLIPACRPGDDGPHGLFTAGEPDAPGRAARSARKAVSATVNKLIWAGVVVLGAISFGVVARTRGEPVNAAWLVVAAVCVYFIAYRFSALFIADTVLGINA